MSAKEVRAACGIYVPQPIWQQHQADCQRCAILAVQTLEARQEAPKPQHRTYSPPMVASKGMEATHTAAVAEWSLQQHTGEPAPVAPTAMQTLISGIVNPLINHINQKAVQTGPEHARKNIQNHIDKALKQNDPGLLAQRLFSINGINTKDQPIVQNIGQEVLQVFTERMLSILLNNENDIELGTVCEALHILVGQLPEVPQLIFQRMHERIQQRLTQPLTTSQLRNLQRSLQVIMDQISGEQIWEQIAIAPEWLPITDVVNTWIMLTLSVVGVEDALPASSQTAPPLSLETASAVKDPSPFTDLSPLKPIGPALIDSSRRSSNTHLSSSSQAPHPDLTSSMESDQTEFCRRIGSSMSTAIKEYDSGALASFMIYLEGGNQSHTITRFTTSILVEYVKIALLGVNSKQLDTIIDAFSLFCAQDDDAAHVVLANGVFEKITMAISILLDNSISREELENLHQSLKHLVPLIQGARWPLSSLTTKVNELYGLTTAMLGSTEDKQTGILPSTVGSEDTLPDISLAMPIVSWASDGSDEEEEYKLTDLPKPISRAPTNPIVHSDVPGKVSDKVKAADQYVHSRLEEPGKLARVSEKTDSLIHKALKSGDSGELANLLLSIGAMGMGAPDLEKIGKLTFDLFLSYMKSAMLDKEDDTQLDTICSALSLIVARDTQDARKIPPLIFFEINMRMRENLRLSTITLEQLNNLKRSSQAMYNILRKDPIWEKIFVHVGIKTMSVTVLAKELMTFVLEGTDLLKSDLEKRAKLAAPLPHPETTAKLATPLPHPETAAKLATHLPHPETAAKLATHLPHPETLPPSVPVAPIGDDYSAEVTASIDQAINGGDSDTLAALFYNLMPDQPPTAIKSVEQKLIARMERAMWNHSSTELGTILGAYKMFCQQGEENVGLFNPIFAELKTNISSSLGTHQAQMENLKKSSDYMARHIADDGHWSAEALVKYLQTL